jgi:hypothetical protein
MCSGNVSSSCSSSDTRRVALATKSVISHKPLAKQNEMKDEQKIFFYVETQHGINFVSWTE